MTVKDLSKNVIYDRYNYYILFSKSFKVFKKISLYRGISKDVLLILLNSDIQLKLESFNHSFISVYTI